jgi:hypothetical protein
MNLARELSAAIIGRPKSLTEHSAGTTSSSE